MYFSTLSNSRTHVAYGANYLGSVNSYNNCLTRLLSKIFNKSIQVEIGGEKRCFNKKSFRKLLKDMGLSTGLQNKRNVKWVKAPQKFSNKGDRMKDHLNPLKVTSLTVKLVQALAKNDNVNALKYAGQGADVRRPFWDRGKALGISWSGSKEGFPIQSFQTTVFSHNAVTYSSIHAAKATTQFLYELAGSPKSLKSHKIAFTRTIEDRRTAGDWLYDNSYSVATAYRDVQLQTGALHFTKEGAAYKEFILNPPIKIEERSYVDIKQPNSMYP